MHHPVSARWTQPCNAAGRGPSTVSPASSRCGARRRWGQSTPTLLSTCALVPSLLLDARVAALDVAGQGSHPNYLPPERRCPRVRSSRQPLQCSAARVQKEAFKDNNRCGRNASDSPHRRQAHDAVRKGHRVVRIPMNCMLGPPPPRWPTHRLSKGGQALLPRRRTHNKGGAHPHVPFVFARRSSA